MLPLPDFPAILAALDAAKVRCVVIGGLAMLAHGSDHNTQDIDICYARDVENLTSLVGVLQALRAQLRTKSGPVPFALDVQTFRNTLNLTLETNLGAIDVLGEVAGVVSFDQLWSRSEIFDLYGVPVHVASLDDLIAMKEATGRLKDQSHILELRALRKLLAADGPSSE